MSFLTWLAYILLPNDAGGLIQGIPLGPFEAAALLMLAWLWLAGRRPPFALIAGVVLGATYAAGAAIPGEGGFRARYFTNAAATGAPERSTEFADAPFTRIDRRLDFRPDGPEFPLPFFNDHRTNFYKPGEPQRRYLEFAVRWSGWWWVDGDRPRVYLDAPGADARMYVDGAEAMVVAAAGGSPAIMELPLTAGWHRLEIVFGSPYAGGRTFSSGIMDGENRVPFGVSMVVTQQIRGWQMTAARLLRRVKFIADVALLTCLSWLIVRQLARLVRDLRQPASAAARLRHVLAAFAAVAAVDGLLFALRWWNRNMVLLGGDDTITYEGYARDILLHGILMTGGHPLGEGEPFYYQAFYPYFLALTHKLFGEGMFGPVFVQRLLAAVAVWKLVEIAVRFADERIWKVALPIAVLYIWWKFSAIAAQPLNESLYLPLLVVTTAALIELCLTPTRRRALAAGVLAGLTTITRSTVLLSWVVVWPACWLALRGVSHRRAVVTILVAATLTVFSLIAIRNWIVAGVFAPTSTELGITLLGGNEVPPGVTIDLTRRRAWYQQFGIGDHTATVIEYAITAPAPFAQNLGRKTLFALGYYEPYAPGWGYSPVYIAVWTSAIAGCVLATRAARHALPALLPALIAFTQFVAVVIVYPKGERLIVPIHVSLIPYSAVTVWYLLQKVAARRRPMRA